MHTQSFAFEARISQLIRAAGTFQVAINEVVIQHWNVLTFTEWLQGPTDIIKME
jgi:hypothetical protein